MKEKNKTVNNTCASGSIQSFFNGTAKVKRKTVPCPVCNKSVELNKINQHMDSSDCVLETDEVQVVEESVVKRKSSEEDLIPDNSLKKHKTDEHTEFLEDDIDDEMLSALCSPTKTSQTIQLSPSISFNPAKFRGVHSMSPSPDKNIVRQGSRSARDKYLRTPTKHKRNTVLQQRPDLPQHDPYTPSKRSDPEYVPYYVTNFEYVIKCVIDCSEDKNLFSDDELDVVDDYRALTLDCKKLFVRLLNRKHAWLYRDKIRYDEIQDTEEALKKLVDTGFLDDENKLNDIEKLLHLLSVNDVKTVAKDLNISLKLTSKQEIIPEVLKLCRRKSGIFNLTVTLEQKLIKKCKTLVNSCFRINDRVRSVLMRVLCLWGLNTWWESKEEGGTPTTLTSILLTNQGQVVYPSYTILRQARIFRDRSDLIAFEEAVKLEESIDQLVMNKDFETAYTSYQSLWSYYDNLDQSMLEHVQQLPVFLQKYTALSVIIVALNKSVDLLEKMKKYDEAVELLGKLLNLNVLDKFRGHWYERMSLDLDSHLKKPREALAAVETGLGDARVRGGRRLMLQQRVVKICSMKKYKLDSELERFTSRPDWQCPTAEDVPSISIHGQMLANDSNNGGKAGKSVWQCADPVNPGVITYCSVEEFSLNHFMIQDPGTNILTSNWSMKLILNSYWSGTVGLHAEGSVFNTLLCLLFWDCIYHVPDLPDVFRDTCQAMPYDWDTDHFYRSRAEMINIRLATMRGWDRLEMSEELVSAWLEHHGQVSLVNWELFSSEEMLRQFVLCFDPLSLSAVMERMISEHRSTRSGLPDLTLWNTSHRTVRMVEVKGPGDKLSTKQILWIQFLNSVGVQTEVCHVLGQGSKFISETRTMNTKGEEETVIKEKQPRKERKPRQERKPRKRNKNDATAADQEDFIS